MHPILYKTMCHEDRRSVFMNFEKVSEARLYVLRQTALRGGVASNIA